MKNKIVTIILGIALLLSVGGNIYLVKTMTDTNEKVNTLSGQLVTADNEIADLQEQLTDISALQAEVNDLQGQLTQSNTQIESLETTITENNTTISDLEERLAERDNMNGGYVVKPNSEPELPTDSGEQTSSTQPTTEVPIVTPEDAPTDHTYDNQQANNDVPQLSGDPSTWPCLPGSEYRPGIESDPGYIYAYPLGWITNNGGTGVTQTGNDMPEWTPCVLDENGNCTIHEHRGE